ncbi:MAG: HEAT repeat domain-containing protein [Candidatus Micrarchaeia archaeon]
MSPHKKPPKPEVHKLVTLLQSEKPALRAKAASKLWEMGPGAVKPLLESLPQGEVPGAGSPQETLIVSVLSKMGRKIVPHLIQALDSDDSSVRELAAIVLGEIADSDTLGVLYQAARSAAEGSLEQALMKAAILKIEGPSEPPSYLTMKEAELAAACAKEEKPEHNPMYL